MYFRGLRKSANDISLSDAIEADGDSGNLSLMDIISADEDMFEQITAAETNFEVRRYVDAVLSDRERSIICMRYGLDGLPPRTQREVAIVCGISRSYVSRLEKKALHKLREAFERNAK